MGVQACIHARVPVDGGLGGGIEVVAVLEEVVHALRPVHHAVVVKDLRRVPGHLEIK